MIDQNFINKKIMDKIIEKGKKDALIKLQLLSVNLIPVLLITSYCGDDNDKCTDLNPCEDCLKMCNIVFIDKSAIKSENVVCGYNFLDSYR